MENKENEIEYFDEDQTIDLLLDDGTSMTCDVIGIFELDDVAYIALAEPEEENILFYIYEEDNGELFLSNIKNKETYEEVVDTFYELFEDLFEEGEE